MIFQSWFLVKETLAQWSFVLRISEEDRRNIKEQANSQGAIASVSVGSEVSGFSQDYGFISQP